MKGILITMVNSKTGRFFLNCSGTPDTIQTKRLHMFRRPDAGFLPRKPRFNPASLRLIFVVDEVA
jgi:hypothetical protein